MAKREIRFYMFNGFQKKTQKTPVSEIDKAERLMKEYFNNK
ncbi:MAG: type II toxin-antitoxin system RelE/ParE family toxin [Alistipes sp.]|nr:type II toxin-antitoxin system RelE/ParE family toxin [Alistipes sp.]